MILPGKSSSCVLLLLLPIMELKIKTEGEAVLTQAVLVLVPALGQLLVLEGTWSTGRSGLGRKKRRLASLLLARKVFDMLGYEGFNEER